MMPDENPFLEGYVAAIRGKTDFCPYEEGTGEAERWCRGFGGKPETRVAAAPAKKPDCHFSLTAEGRRPFVEGYKAAILAIRFGKNTVCPYEDGTSEHQRWWKGFREPVASTAKFASKPATSKKPIMIPVLEGRRPFVEGYKSQILATRFGKNDTCPYEEGTSEYERWTKGFTKNPRGQIATKVAIDQTAVW